MRENPFKWHYRQFKRQKKGCKIMEFEIYQYRIDHSQKGKSKFLASPFDNKGKIEAKSCKEAIEKYLNKKMKQWGYNYPIRLFFYDSHNRIRYYSMHRDDLHSPIYAYTAYKMKNVF